MQTQERFFEGCPISEMGWLGSWIEWVERRGSGDPRYSRSGVAAENSSSGVWIPENHAAGVKATPF